MCFNLFFRYLGDDFSYPFNTDGLGVHRGLRGVYGHVVGVLGVFVTSGSLLRLQLVHLYGPGNLFSLTGGLVSCLIVYVTCFLDVLLVFCYSGLD